MAKDVRHDIVIFGDDDLEVAKRDAAAVPGERARVIKAERPYFIVVDGQRCPCCGGAAKIEFL